MPSFNPVTMARAPESDKSPNINCRPAYLGPGLVIRQIKPLVSLPEAKLSQTGLVVL